MSNPERYRKHNRKRAERSENRPRDLQSIWQSLRNREAGIGSEQLKAQVTLPKLKFLEKEPIE